MWNEENYTGERRKGAEGGETVTDRDAVVVGVPDDFVLEFLPSLERLVHQDLRAAGQRLADDLEQLVVVVRETRTQTTQRVGRPHEHWVAQSPPDLQRLNRRHNNAIFLLSSASYIYFWMQR